MRADRRRTLGAAGEDAVERWYRLAGHAVMARNWRCAEGEIDLITRAPDGTLVFCEVKTRSGAAFGSPFEAVTVAKQRRLRRLAVRWLAERRSGAAAAVHVGRTAEVRFDVAGVLVGRGGELTIEVLESAF